MSQKLCTLPPQTSARLLALDIMETAITVIDQIVISIVVIDIIEAIDTTEAEDLTIVATVTTETVITVIDIAVDMVIRKTYGKET